MTVGEVFAAPASISWVLSNRERDRDELVIGVISQQGRTIGRTFVRWIANGDTEDVKDTWVVEEIDDHPWQPYNDMRRIHQQRLTEIWAK